MLRFTPQTEIEVTPNNLTAVLTCYGAQADEDVRQILQERQNPYAQKRGGLGYGLYSNVRTSGSAAQFANINLFATKQAKQSPLRLELLDETGRFIRLLDARGRSIARGSTVPFPSWGRKSLQSGKQAIEVVQQHGPNYVSVWGDTRCELFENESACSFCTFNGNGNNVSRSVRETWEAMELIQRAKKRSNLTLTTGWTDTDSYEALTQDIAWLKERMGENPLALEIAPFRQGSLDVISELQSAGLDTLMIPLDCASLEAQQQFIPGKASLLNESYWDSVKEGVRVFGQGNVTSSLIIGLEDLEISKATIRKMLQAGVVPEPLPVRWNDDIDADEALPLTNPNELIEIRQFLITELKRESVRSNFAKIKSGCAACGGCTGFSMNQLR